MPLLKLGFGFRMLWAGRHAQGQGNIKPFIALMTSLAATIGTGNIAGVATVVLAFHIEKIPEAIYQIVLHAFSPTAAAGGFAGAPLMLGIQT